jgi:hypothetical protein
MKKAFFTLCLMFLQIIVSFSQESNTWPERLRRSESFLGIHFDFHAGEDSKQVGVNTNRELIEYIIDMVQPDYIQCDAKGHPGYSSYPTKVGNQAPGIIGDPLMIWREVTAERGVALYVHYSGVWDEQAARKHPEWARIKEDGQHDDRLNSVYGPYVDQLLIPQLKEMSDVYKLDGIWIDGECWATERDYNPEVLKKFQEITGITDIPGKPEDRYWFEFSEFCRQGFRDYVNHYVSEIHNHSRDFQIASNWAYSSQMPEPVTIDVDFISGDYSSRNSVNSARWEGRCFVYQGKPWDLMAWSFTWTNSLYSTKTIPQLQREAAVVLALGGGFQAYFRQKRDGSIRKWQMELMKETAQFCRERQEFCHKATPVPQIGLIYSGKAFYKMNYKLFAGWNKEVDGAKGILQALLESQNVVDVVMEHHLENRYHEYPLLIYPEWGTIEPDLKDALMQYVRQGGNLLVVGPASAGLFEDELGIQLVGEPEDKINGLEYNGWLAGISSLSQKVQLENDVAAFGKIYENNDNIGAYETAASIRNLGKGKIAGIYLNLGRRYLTGKTTVTRDFINGVVQELFPDKIVDVVGSHNVDVTLNRMNGKLAVNLVNTAGPHDDHKIWAFDEIPNTGPLDLTIKYPENPQKVIIEPGHRKINYQYVDGKIQMRLPGLEIHDIILID